MPRQLDVRFEQVLGERANLEVYCSAHPFEHLRPLLKKRGIMPWAVIKQMKSGSWVRFSGLLILVHTPPVRSGRRIMFVTLEDETGLIDLVVFPSAQIKGARLLFLSEVVTGAGILKREGYEGVSAIIVAKQFSQELSGPLDKVFKAYEKKGLSA